MKPASDTDLILNPDKSVYHLGLRPGDIADTIILVGDPGRVEMISSMFDHRELIRQKREFVTHTGTYRGKRITALSTGIGCDNIDIVLNELDALVNMDLEQRRPLKERKSLTLVRIGTSGGLHEDIVPGQSIMGRIACGFDGLYHFYKDRSPASFDEAAREFAAHTSWKSELPYPYFIQAAEDLADRLSDLADHEGITVSTPGFYAPQFRRVRLAPFDSTTIEDVATFSYRGLRVSNFEMESSALYALSSLLGHRAVTLCVAIANRISSSFLEDYQPALRSLIDKLLNKLCCDEA